jgi:membrane-associated protease RseP (regulator of RpoE activity)
MLLALALLVLASVFRVFVLYVPVLSNFSPVMALAFCAGAYTRDRWMWLAPFAALIVSDLYINHYYASVYHYEWSTAGAVIRIACFGAALGIGVLVSRRRNWLNLMGGALAGSVLFYLVTNTASWFGDAAYSRDGAGLWQALTVGHPQYYPTIFFFRNSLASDLLFTGCFALVMEYASLRRGDPSLLGLKQVGR